VTLRNRQARLGNRTGAAEKFLKEKVFFDIKLAGRRREKLFLDG